MGTPKERTQENSWSPGSWDDGFRARLRALLTDRQMSNSKLARRLSGLRHDETGAETRVSPTRVREWLSQVLPKADALREIATVTKVDLNWLLLGPTEAGPRYREQSHSTAELEDGLRSRLRDDLLGRGIEPGDIDAFLPLLANDMVPSFADELEQTIRQLRPLAVIAGRERTVRQLLDVPPESLTEDEKRRLLETVYALQAAEWNEPVPYTMGNYIAPADWNKDIRVHEPSAEHQVSAGDAALAINRSVPELGAGLVINYTAPARSAAESKGDDSERQDRTEGVREGRWPFFRRRRKQ